jgi:predicted PurR-regulated permease PerM
VAHEVLLLGFLAVLVAMVFSFPVRWLARVMPRGAAVLVVLVALAGAVAGLVAAAAPTLADQIDQVKETAPRGIRQARRWLERVQRQTAPAQPPGAPEPARPPPPDVAQTVTDKAVPAIVATVELVTGIVLVLVLAAFLIHEPETYRRGLRHLVPPSEEKTFDLLWDRTGTALRRWVGGILVAMLLMGTLTSLGLLAIGLDNWLLLGVLTFLGTFVPYLGAIASAIPGLLVALAQSPRHFGLAAIVYLAVHLVEGYVVEPTVMRRAVEVKPAVLLFGQALLGAVFGVLGVVVATPLVVCGQILAGHLWVERRLGKPAAPAA